MLALCLAPPFFGSSPSASGRMSSVLAPSPSERGLPALTPSPSERGLPPLTPSPSERGLPPLTPSPFGRGLGRGPESVVRTTAPTFFSSPPLPLGEGRGEGASLEGRAPMALHVASTAVFTA